MKLRLFAATFVGLLCSNVLASPSKHKITFTFDYDFGITPACSAEIKKGCVKQFNFYDISVGIPKRVPLGSRPVPVDATGLVKGISFTTKRRLFKPGKHRVAVAAQLENGLESDLEKCAVVVKMR